MAPTPRPEVSGSADGSNSALARQSYHKECEEALNKHINLHLHASYVYASMSVYVNRDDVALSGFQKYFHNNAFVEKDNAEKLMGYQNSRGGRVSYEAICKPLTDEWGSGAECMQKALDVDKSIYTSLNQLHDIAVKHNDAHFSDFIEDDFMEGKLATIKEKADHLANLRRVGSGMGEYMFDKETLGGSCSHHH